MAYDALLSTGRILQLTINRTWFDMIASGEKKEEYRELKQYWMKRLRFFEAFDNTIQPLFAGERLFDYVRFRNGYSKNAPELIVECEGVSIGIPKAKWCGSVIDFDADNGSYDRCFIISLGNVIKNSALAAPCT